MSGIPETITDSFYETVMIPVIGPEYRRALDLHRQMHDMSVQCRMAADNGMRTDPKSLATLADLIDDYQNAVGKYLALMQG